MHQHVLPMFMFPDMPLFCVKNCGCRHPERAHCLSCHKSNEQFKIKQRSDQCCGDLELEYLFVIDFECTCDEKKRLEIQEIIEFPIIVIDLKEQAIVDKFHSFVRPVVYPQLTPFCTRLTGITQDKVDNAPILPDVLKQVDKFLEKYISNGLSRVAVLNDCDSDIRNFLRKESTYKGISVKPVFKEFIDLRRIFPVKISEKPTNIDFMLHCMGLEFEGVKHSGIDDATNIARVALEIAKRDYVYTDRLKEHMYPIENPHYYEHLVIITAQPKMKNNVELAMIAHDLRKNKTLWNNVGMKNVKQQEMKKELFDFLDKVGIDVDNSILCVQGKLEHEVKAFFKQPENSGISDLINGAASSTSEKLDKLETNIFNKSIKVNSHNHHHHNHHQHLSNHCSNSNTKPADLNTSACSTASSSLSPNSSMNSIQSSASQTSQIQQQQQQQPQQSTSQNNFFTTYFSLNKISKIAGVPVLPSNQQSLLPTYPSFSQRYQQSRQIYQPQPLGQQTYSHEATFQPSEDKLDNHSNFFQPNSSRGNNYFLNSNSFTNNSMSNSQADNYFMNSMLTPSKNTFDAEKWWNSSANTTSAAFKLTSMCGTVERALQNGFIFTKDFASTISLKRALAKM